MANTLTLANAANIVADRIHDTTSATKTIIKTELNIRKDFMISQRQDWEWMEADSTFNTTADEESYTLDNDPGGIGVNDLERFMGPLRIEAELQLVRPISIEEYTQHFIDPTEGGGMPRFYTVWNDRLVLAPTPEDVYAINYRYYRRINDLGDTNVAPWPARFNWIWLVGAEAQMLEYNDDSRADQKWAQHFRGISSMVGDTEIQDEGIRMSGWSEGQGPGIEEGFDRSIFGPTVDYL